MPYLQDSADGSEQAVLFDFNDQSFPLITTFLILNQNGVNRNVVILKGLNEVRSHRIVRISNEDNFKRFIHGFYNPLVDVGSYRAKIV